MLVNAWVQENHAVFGQVRSEADSNEITAILKLLELSDLVSESQRQADHGASVLHQQSVGADSQSDRPGGA